MLLTIEQLKQKLGVKESWIRAMIFKGIIPCVRLGRLIRFDEEVIDEWVRENSSKSEVDKRLMVASRSTAASK